MDGVDEQLDVDQHDDLVVQCVVEEVLVDDEHGLVHDEQACDEKDHDVQVLCHEHNHDGVLLVGESLYHDMDCEQLNLAVQVYEVAHNEEQL